RCTMSKEREGKLTQIRGQEKKRKDKLTRRESSQRSGKEEYNR
ncbi:763_t:CDS:1, partial [Cetraspora pellucida]